MVKYHVNPVSGDVGKCGADFKCRFGESSEHYTSPEAARKAFEDSQKLFPSPPPKKSAKEFLDQALVMIPGEKITPELYASLPVDTVILEVHHESEDQRYYSKGQDGKTRSISLGSSGLPVSDKYLFHSGSKGFYLAEHSFENVFKASQLKHASADLPATAKVIAYELHHNWRVARNFEPRIKVLADSTEIDIAALTYDELPERWQRENLETAKAALSTIRVGIANRWSRSRLGDSIHRSWLERNKDSASKDQRKPYDELSRSEQLKDLLVLEAAAAVIASYPQEKNGG